MPYPSTGPRAQAGWARPTNSPRRPVQSTTGCGCPPTPPCTPHSLTRRRPPRTLPQPAQPVALPPARRPRSAPHPAPSAQRPGALSAPLIQEDIFVSFWHRVDIVWSRAIQRAATRPHPPHRTSTVAEDVSNPTCGRLLVIGTLTRSSRWRRQTSLTLSDWLPSPTSSPAGG